MSDARSDTKPKSSMPTGDKPAGDKPAGDKPAAAKKTPLSQADTSPEKNPMLTEEARAAMALPSKQGDTAPEKNPMLPDDQRKGTGNKNEAALLAQDNAEKEAEKKIKQGSRQQRFLAQSVILEEAGLSRLVRMAILLVTAVVVTFILWASYSVIDEVAPAPGEVVPSSTVQIVQHLEGGIIQTIHVKSGDLVEKDSLLVTLDPAPVLAEFKQNQARLTALKLQQERIKAFIEERPPNFQAVPAEFTDIATSQMNLLKAQNESLASQRELLHSQVLQRDARLKGIDEQEKIQNSQMKLVERELHLNEQGMDKGLVSQMTVLSTKREMQRVISELTRLHSERIQISQELKEMRRKLVDMDNTTRQEATRELSTITTEAAQVTKVIERLQDKVNRLKITSPLRGIIKELKVTTQSGVISPGGTIAEIVPVDKSRYAEVHINTRDIGHISTGQLVTIKVTTYDFARYGGITGRLEAISPATFTDDNGQPYYLGKVRLDRNYVGTIPGTNEVLPGMAIQASIHTGSKTLMEYLLKPIVSSVNDSFRER
ncbi:MAG: HlyD family type I secretion periplasmic adaptor subunit [Magnetococcales bacterium]|nr:HlyD family type I secretion periplasmic adaptor subunit [Magnetococcales bacterium]